VGLLQIRRVESHNDLSTPIDCTLDHIIQHHARDVLEGNVAVRGSMQGQAKEGVGYVDLTGYRQQVNLQPYL
jgi:hypothetical protein